MTGGPILARPASSSNKPVSDHLVGLVGRFAITAQGGGLGALIKFADSRRDQRVFALEEAVAVHIALDQERTELLDVEHPDRLGKTKLLDPMHARHLLDAAS